jgi:hypothetical protein
MHKEPRKYNYNSTFGEPCASPNCCPPSSSAATMPTLEKEANHYHNLIWENTFTYNDAFQADEPGRR